ncbi:MAG: hypothetical protein F3745_00130 [Nitrospinae bacterium]|nr:hypothetical protein [Nitrospinota bacterium]|tara:strand:+ start:890 stop:1147 length:258 start_codon:yes stop_codon:yes gene_type:complete
MKKLSLLFLTSAFFLTTLLQTSVVAAKQPKAKFYDFSEQLIDGEIKKPTTLYTDARESVKFGRLLKLKKSFLPKLFNTSKERVFK